MMKDVAGAPDVSVVIPAAGEGRRIGGERKQFRRLGDAPLLVQTLRAFDRHPLIVDLVVVCPSRDVESLRTGLSQFGLTGRLTVVSGGSSRQESVRLGLTAVAADSAVVLIHDAVRPFISTREISDVVAAARKYGAAAVGIAVTDTLRRVSGERYGRTVPREGLFRMLTPQGFETTLIRRAHDAALRSGRAATDDVEVAQMAGHDVYVVEGSSDNFKITTPEDWCRAETLWETWQQEHRS